MEHWFRHVLSFIAVLTLSACGPKNNGNERGVPPLPEGTEAYLDFWWRNGEGANSQYLWVVRAEPLLEDSATVRMVLAEVPKSELGWKQLFQFVEPDTHVTHRSFRLVPDIHAQSRESIQKSVNEELGGLAKHQRTVKDGLAVDGQTLNVAITGNALVIHPPALEGARRESVLNSLVLFDARGKAEEKQAGGGDAYLKSVSRSFETTGWLLTSAAVADGSTRALLVEYLSTQATERPVFSTLGLLER